MKFIFALLLALIAPAAGAQDTHIPGNLYVGGGGAFSGSVTAANFTNAGLTASRVPFASAGGLLTDAASLTFASGTGILSATGFAGALNGTVGAVTPAAGVFTGVTDSGLTISRVPYAGTGGLLLDNAALFFNSGTGVLSATGFSGALTGNASSATTATNFNNGTSSSSGGTVTATTFSGALSGNATTATTAGTVTTAAQPAITSVGTLSSLAVTGAITGSGYSGGAIAGTTGAFSAAISTGSGSGTSAGLFLNYYGVSGYGAIWATAVSPISTNYALVTNGAITTINGTTNTNIAIGGAAVAGATASGLSITNLQDNGAHLIISSTAPAIASGFGTSPSIIANNTAAFQITIGTGATATQGTLTMPTAPNGWTCLANNITTIGATRIAQGATNATSVVLSQISTNTGTLVAFGVADKINIMCHAF